MVDRDPGQALPNNTVADPEDQTNFDQMIDVATVERLEEAAAGYLDTVDAALASFTSYVDSISPIDPQDFDGTGMNTMEIRSIMEFGDSVRVNAPSGDPDDPDGYISNGKKVSMPRVVRNLVSTYNGVKGSKVFTDIDSQDPNVIDGLAEKAAHLATDKIALDAYSRELKAVTKDIPPSGIYSILVGLSFVRLSQFFKLNPVQEGMAANPSLTDSFRNEGIYQQGGYFALAYYTTRNITSLRKTLRDVLSYSDQEVEDQEEMINDYLVEITLIEKIEKSILHCHPKIGSAYSALVSTAIDQAATVLHDLSRATPTLESLDGSHDNAQAMIETEEAAVSANRRICRRIKDIVARANSLRDQGDPIDPDFSMVRALPVLEPQIANYIKQHEASKTAGAIATKRATEVAKKQALLTEFARLHEPYQMTRAEIKSIPGSNDVTAALIKGEIGDEGSKAEALGKEDAYDMAGIIFALNGQLDTKSRNAVFDKLFETYEKEAELIEELGGQPTDFNLTGACDWLINNVASMQTSEIDSLRRLGDELAFYGRMHRTPIGQRLERAARQMSAKTLQAIEELRTNVDPLDIRAFPPGVSNRELLEEDALDIATRPGKRQIPMLDGERLIAIDDLSVLYSEAGYETQLYRLLPGSLKEQFPYYALVISTPGHKVIIAENPKTGNATYVFDELDPSLAKWEEMIQLDKQSVRELGGRAMRHDPKQSLQEHFSRVNGEVTLRLSS